MIYSIKNFLPDFEDENAVKENLRKRLREYLGCTGVTLVSSGTTGLEVALKALELPRGTQVIIPDISFIATAVAVAKCGLIPVFGDVSEKHFGLTLDAVRENYSEKTGAVIIVHIAGYMAREILQIKKFCEEKDIFLIEDAAQAFPCTIGERHAGTIGDIGVFSLQSSKIINSCEGGIVATNSKKLHIAAEQIADWCFFDGKRNFDLPGENYRLSAIQSYFIHKQLDVINRIIDERTRRAGELTAYCKKTGIEVSAPLPEKNIFDCPFFFVIRSNKNLNMIEPRSECPMRQSALVKTIIRRFYPNLLKEYIAANILEAKNTPAQRVVRDNEFINIHQQNGKTPEEIFKDYIGA